MSASQSFPRAAGQGLRPTPGAPPPAQRVQPLISGPSTALAASKPAGPLMSAVAASAVTALRHTTREVPITKWLFDDDEAVDEYDRKTAGTTVMAAHEWELVAPGTLSTLSPEPSPEFIQELTALKPTDRPRISYNTGRPRPPRSAPSDPFAFPSSPSESSRAGQARPVSSTLDEIANLVELFDDATIDDLEACLDKQEGASEQAAAAWTEELTETRLSDDGAHERHCRNDFNLGARYGLVGKEGLVDCIYKLLDTTTRGKTTAHKPPGYSVKVESMYQLPGVRGGHGDEMVDKFNNNRCLVIDESPTATASWMRARLPRMEKGFRLGNTLVLVFSVTELATAAPLLSAWKKQAAEWGGHLDYVPLMELDLKATLHYKGYIIVYYDTGDIEEASRSSNNGLRGQNEQEHLSVDDTAAEHAPKSSENGTLVRGHFTDPLVQSRLRRWEDARAVLRDLGLVVVPTQDLVSGYCDPRHHLLAFDREVYKESLLYDLSMRPDYDGPPVQRSPYNPFTVIALADQRRVFRARAVATPAVVEAAERVRAEAREKAPMVASDEEYARYKEINTYINMLAGAKENAEARAAVAALQDEVKAEIGYTPRPRESIKTPKERTPKAPKQYRMPPSGRKPAAQTKKKAPQPLAKKTRSSTSAKVTRPEQKSGLPRSSSQSPQAALSTQSTLPAPAAAAVYHSSEATTLSKPWRCSVVYDGKICGRPLGKIVGKHRTFHQHRGHLPEGISLPPPLSDRPDSPVIPTSSILTPAAIFAPTADAPPAATACAFDDAQTRRGLEPERTQEAFDDALEAEALNGSAQEAEAGPFDDAQEALDGSAGTHDGAGLRSGSKSERAPLVRALPAARVAALNPSLPDDRALLLSTIRCGWRAVPASMPEQERNAPINRKPPAATPDAPPRPRVSQAPPPQSRLPPHLPPTHSTQYLPAAPTSSTDSLLSTRDRADLLRAIGGGWRAVPGSTASTVVEGAFASREVLDVVAEHAHELAQDRYGSHAVQALVKQAPGMVVPRLLDAVVPSALELAQDRYGSHVVRALIEHGPTMAVPRLLDALVPSALELAQDQYGNHVVQTLVKQA
ncbi:hypothetical protein JCM3770_000199, partial [Rhodotorula araucariae]